MSGGWCRPLNRTQTNLVISWQRHPENPLTISFAAMPSHPTGKVTLRYNFGDGSTADIQTDGDIFTVDHTYPDHGEYLVTVRSVTAAAAVHIATETLYIDA